MILQQVPLNNIEETILKQYYTNIGEAVPNVDIDRKYEVLFSDKSKAMLFDAVHDSSLLFSKINIADIFDKPIDISLFEKSSGQLTASTDELNILLAGYNTQLKLINETNSDQNKSAVKKFNTFLKVVGLTGLNIDDVVLVEQEKSLTIIIADTQPLLRGSLEIKTW